MFHLSVMFDVQCVRSSIKSTFISSILNDLVNELLLVVRTLHFTREPHQNDDILETI